MYRGVRAGRIVAHTWLVAVIMISAPGPVHAHGEGDHVIVCSWFTSNVLRYDALDGSFDQALVPSGGGGLFRAHSLTIGPNGNLFVTSTGSHEVLEYDLDDGTALGPFVTAGSGGLNGPANARFGPDGLLYVASLNSSSVLKYDGVTGDPMGTAVAPFLGGLNGAESVNFHADGDLLVVSGNSNEVLRYDRESGAFLGEFVAAGNGLSNPHEAVFGPDGHLYVTSFGANKVIKYDGLTGAFIEVVVEDDAGTPGTDESGGLSAAHGLAFDDQGRLYVASFSSNQVLMYDGVTGAFLGVYIGSGNGLSGTTALLFIPADAIPGDLDDDGIVGVIDLLALLGQWGGPGTADITGPAGAPDGTVDVLDLLLLLGNWG